MREVQVASEANPTLGNWRMVAHPGMHGYPGSIDVSTQRDIPAVVEKMSFSDPFGPKAATITYPQFSYYDKLGVGDLWWLRPFVTTEIVWEGSLPPNYPHGRITVRGDSSTWWHPKRVSTSPAFSWLGRAVSFRYGAQGLSVDYQGAFYQLDDWTAKPEYPHQPLPYEWAIAKQFLHRPALRLKPLTIVWPDWWSTVYTPPAKNTVEYLIPAQVHKGRNWSGLTTRETGKWDPVGTSYIQTLLGSMYTRRGRFTIDIFEGGMPVMLHRDIQHVPADDMVVCDVTGPNDLSFDEDWLQSLGVVYGQGTSLGGVAYSGMQVSPDGSITRYEPMASLRQVHPEHARHNEWFQPNQARREVMLSMQQGLDELQAQQVALSHLQQFSHPGQTGQLVLREDPMINGVAVSRMLVRAGMTVQVPGIFGSKAGLIAHISDNECDFNDETNTLTLDTKYRDSLTVAEVRMRGRDSLHIPRVLAVGQWQPPIPDQLVPWDYASGSGYIPSAHSHGLNSLRLFDEMPADTEFPWEDWTTTHPPSNPRWRKSYISVGKARANATRNWAFIAGSQKGGRLAIPVRASQAGDIRLTQIAAYDSAGNVLPVSFHASFYVSRGANVQSMPKIPAFDDDPTSPDYYPYTHPPYATSQRYPYVVDGWNKYTARGTLTDPQIPQPTSTIGLVRGYGDYYERAGYWPGSMSRGDSPTGLLVDESTWHFDTTEQGSSVFQPYTTLQPQYKGMLYLMIYCDDQGDEPVYFLGRLFRAEPGQQG